VESVLARKLSVRAAARELGVSTASAWRLLRAHSAGAGDARATDRGVEEVAIA